MKRLEFHYENGVQDFVSYLNEDKEIFDASSLLWREDNGFKVDIPQYNDGFSR